jgi:hypothetical protein
MNPETTYIEMKSAIEWVEYLNRLEKFIRTTDCTDETIQQLELKLQSLTALLKPDNSTSKDQEAEKIKELFKTFWNHGH